MEKKRIEWVDSLKGFAIICVVLGHIVKGYIDAGLYTENADIMYDIYNFIYSFHMALFFAISGFLFFTAYTIGDSQSSDLKVQSVNRQMLNLLLLYIGYSLLLGFSKMLFPGAVTNQVTVIDLFMIWAKPIQLFWYLYVLLMYYAIFRINKIRNLNPGLLLAMLSFISVSSGIIPPMGWFRITDFLYYSFFFAAGTLLARKDISGAIEVIGAIISIVSIILIICFWSRERCLFSIPFASFIIALGMTFLFFEVFRKIRILQSFSVFKLCGKYNLEIYLLHSFTVTAGRSILVKLGINAYLSIIINLTVSLLITIMVGITTKKIGIYEVLFRPYSYIEKYKKNRQV